MEYIEVNKEEIPETFDIDLADETFTLSFDYNETGDFFTVDLYKTGDFGIVKPIILGEKIILNRPLWSDFVNLNLPAPMIVPMDLSNTETSITWDNFNKTVFLYLDNEGESDDAT